ncbi:hypothetical protein IE53DRAFT_244900 [Violaceomyces palustris]|uniref:Uncharacterized protein n=1 Tax=Violaceomyces palustris TaxID=1673888 RepID=A0ACD0P472_9BASI|nr:hypothetical protein IE53DRAFT_244900 [Violaceomyces palustris]
MPPAPRLTPSKNPEIKPQKACVLCRRSKVKCVHEGGPPCKRCVDNKLECKFRLRADDENWRERTDETLNRLEGSVDFLMSQHRSQSVKPGNSSGYHTSSPQSPANLAGPSRIRKQSPFYDSSASIQSGHLMDAHPPPPIPPSNRVFPQTHQRHQGTPSSSASFPSPHFGQNGGEAPSSGPRPSSYRPSSTTYLAFEGAGGLLSQGESSMRTNPGRIAPSVAGRARAAQAHFAGLEMDQTKPSSIIAQVHSELSYLPDPSRMHEARREEKAAISPYAVPTRYIGREDPRLTVISMGLVTMDTARMLFMFFARHLQPHSFGFPSYPANENMTPLIIASLLMVASLHEPSSRHLHDRFRHEAFASLNIEQEVNRDNALDPELGIGVEEITGACIAACWLGGETAWKIARIARWWAVAYLKHFEVRSAQTLGEWMTILPPFRQIDLVEKLRIWLMSYVTEAQQACMHDRPSLIPDCSPAPYCEGLLNSSKNSVMNASKTGVHNNSFADFPHQALATDRQLVAHAQMMSIILAGQEIQREAKRNIAISKSSSPGGGNVPGSAAATYEARQLIERWREWLEELNNWRIAAAQQEDLSSTTENSVDLSLLYHLSRAFLASLPLDPELGIIEESHQAMRPGSNHINDPRLAIAQLRTISTAKHSAIFALELATRPGKAGFGDRLSYLPNFYHFLLGHAAGLLLTLVQRKTTFLMAKEADSLLETTERFIQLYVFKLSSHSFHSPGSGHGLGMTSTLFSASTPSSTAGGGLGQGGGGVGVGGGVGIGINIGVGGMANPTMGISEVNPSSSEARNRNPSNHSRYSTSSGNVTIGIGPSGGIDSDPDLDPHSHQHHHAHHPHHRDPENGFNSRIHPSDGPNDAASEGIPNPSMRQVGGDDGMNHQGPGGNVGAGSGNAGANGVGGGGGGIGGTGDRHPSLANAEALARALYQVKMQKLAEEGWY